MNHLYHKKRQLKINQRAPRKAFKAYRDNRGAVILSLGNYDQSMHNNIKLTPVEACTLRDWLTEQLNAIALEVNPGALGHSTGGSNEE